MNDPTKPRSRKVSAFASAIESASVTAEIAVEDVLKLNPAFSRAEARQFLRANADAIANGMLGGGATILYALLEEGRDVN
jgi:hypothetical protein